MPRRHRRWSMGAPKVKQPKAPKPPKASKMKKPNASVLRHYYKAFVTPDLGQRADSLTRALQWYDEATQFIIKSGVKLTPERVKAQERAAKTWASGAGPGRTNEEKDTFFRLAIQSYEKFIDPDFQVPKLQMFLDILDSKKDWLKAKQDRLESKLGDLFAIMNKALQPKNVKGLPVTVGIGQVLEPYKMDPEHSQLNYRRDEAKKLRLIWRRQGLLPLILAVMDPVSRICSLEDQIDAQTGLPTGNHVTRLSVQMQKQNELWQNVVAFLQQPDAPKRVVRMPHLMVAAQPGAPPDPNKPAVQRKAPVGGFGRGGTKVDGLFTVGSTRAKAYEFLKDGKEHTMAEFKNLCVGENPSFVLRVLADRVGRANYKIEQTGDKVRMVTL